MKQRTLVGCFEVISLPQFNLHDVVAKIDTGAFSGAVHCTDIKMVRRGVLRTRVLTFTPAGRPDLAMETKEFTKRHVRSSNGHRAVRYLVPTIVIIQGKRYKIEIGLSDRSDMKKQVLIGRRFLRENKIIVDVGLNTEYDDEGDTAQ